MMTIFKAVPATNWIGAAIGPATSLWKRGRNEDKRCRRCTSKGWTGKGGEEKQKASQHQIEIALLLHFFLLESK